MNENLPYIYGKLIQEVKKNTYTGKNTSSAITTVNNGTNEISVDVTLKEVSTDILHNGENVLVLSGGTSADIQG